MGVGRAVGGWLALLAVACAGPWATACAGRDPAALHGPWRGPGSPTTGDAVAAVHAGLDAPPPGGGDVAITQEERFHRATDGRWAPVDEDGLAGRGGRTALVVERRCRISTGFLRRTEYTRTSWFLFGNGRLDAFDHSEFGTGCVPRRRFGASPPGDLADEKTLVRYVAQRYPVYAPDAEDELRYGLALVRVGRLEEARHWLSRGENVLADLEHRSERPLLADDEKRALDDRIDGLRALRAELIRALREAERARP